MLRAPDSYLESSERAIRDICNGCGSSSAKFDFVPDTIWGLDISEACNIHDWMYYHGESLEEKAEADRIFMDNMAILIRAGSDFPFIRRLRMFRAKHYYMAVCAFGTKAFLGGDGTNG